MFISQMLGASMLAYRQYNLEDQNGYFGAGSLTSRH